MDNVTDEIIKRKIAAALNEPPVPQELVERTVDRVNAVISGREAEKQLAALSPAAPAALKTQLAAKAVTGRLIMNRRPPADVTSAQMTGQLAANERFCAFTSGDPVRLAHDIRSGELILRMTAPEELKQASASAVASQKIKQPEAPSQGSPSV